MELSDKKRKSILLVIGVIVLVILIAIIIQTFGGFIGTRVVPGLSETVVGGRLNANTLQQGSNTLEFSARTRDGKVVSDVVTFELLPPDAYGPQEELPPDPYGPQEEFPPY